MPAAAIKVDIDNLVKKYTLYSFINVVFNKLFIGKFPRAPWYFHNKREIILLQMTNNGVDPFALEAKSQVCNTVCLQIKREEICLGKLSNLRINMYLQQLLN